MGRTARPRAAWAKTSLLCLEGPGLEGLGPEVRGPEVRESEVDSIAGAQAVPRAQAVTRALIRLDFRPKALSRKAPDAPSWRPPIYEAITCIAVGSPSRFPPGFSA